MIRTLLINEINVDLNEEHNMFFLIGNIKEKREEILDLFNNINSEYYLKSLLKHNGVTIRVKTEKVPEIIKELIKIGCKIYGVYEFYEPI